MQNIKKVFMTAYIRGFIYIYIYVYEMTVFHPYQNKSKCNNDQWIVVIIE